MKRVLLVLIVLALIPCLSGCVTTAVLNAVADDMLRNAVEPGNETEIPGERADYRRAVIGFARENVELLDALVAEAAAMECVPRGIDVATDGDTGGPALVAHLWGCGDVPVDDDLILEAFVNTPLRCMYVHDGAWIFDTDYSRGTLDVSRDYEILYGSAAVPQGLDWLPCGSGFVKESHAPGCHTYEYIQQIGDRLYYRYAGLF